MEGHFPHWLELNESVTMATTTSAASALVIPLHHPCAPVRIMPLPKSADPQRRAMLDPASAGRLADEIVALISRTVRERLDFLPAGALVRARAAVTEFIGLYECRPVRDNWGGLGFNDSFWLFALARAIAPDLIVENGVHQGHTTWLLRAACPDATLHSFDIDLGNLVYVDDRALYYEHDWMEAEISAADGQRSLVFFDDHVSHVQRIHEAWRRGFRLAVLDDNFPAHNLYATGRPPVPTLDMIFDLRLDCACDIEWTRKGKIYSYRYDPVEVAGVRGLIDRYEVLPELASLTRDSIGSRLSVVKLAPDVDVAD